MKTNNFKTLSRLADQHSISNRDQPDFHSVGSVLHDAAAKLGKISGLSFDHPLIQHHANSAIWHHDMGQGYGKPTEGPHAPLKGGFLGQPVINTPGK